MWKENAGPEYTSNFLLDLGGLNEEVQHAVHLHAEARSRPLSTHAHTHPQTRTHTCAHSCTQTHFLSLSLFSSLPWCSNFLSPSPPSLSLALSSPHSLLLFLTSCFISLGLLISALPFFLPPPDIYSLIGASLHRPPSTPPVCAPASTHAYFIFYTTFLLYLFYL